ncbi:MAG: SAM-dependent methyltransferase, partial [Burkholderiales bacterium]
MTGAVRAETSQAPFQPVVGQEGKDVVWVPTPPALVEKMLDMARVTPQDY